MSEEIGMIVVAGLILMWFFGYIVGLRDRSDSGKILNHPTEPPRPRPIPKKRRFSKDLSERIDDMVEGCEPLIEELRDMINNPPKIKSPLTEGKMKSYQKPMNDNRKPIKPPPAPIVMFEIKGLNIRKFIRDNPPAPPQGPRYG